MTRKSLDLGAAAEAIGSRAVETGDKAEAALRMQGLAPQQLAETLGDVTRQSGHDFARNTRRSRRRLVKAARRGGTELSRSAQEAAQEFNRISVEAQQQAGRMLQRAREDTVAQAARARRRRQWRRWVPWLVAAAVVGTAAAVMCSRARAASHEAWQHGDGEPAPGTNAT